MSVSWAAFGLVLFLPGTVLISVGFDVVTRRDWRTRYGPIEGLGLSDLLRNRFVQIFVVIVLQFVLMVQVLFILGRLYYTPTGNPILNDMIFSHLSIIAACIAFVVVIVPWFGYLAATVLFDHHTAKAGKKEKKE